MVHWRNDRKDRFPTDNGGNSGYFLLIEKFPIFILLFVETGLQWWVDCWRWNPLLSLVRLIRHFTWNSVSNGIFDDVASLIILSYIFWGFPWVEVVRHWSIFVRLLRFGLFRIPGLRIHLFSIHNGIFLFLYKIGSALNLTYSFQGRSHGYNQLFFIFYVVKTW